MKHDNVSTKGKQRIAVRLPSDAECEDIALQERLCAFLYSVSMIVPHRRLGDALYRAAMRCGTVLLDADGNRAKPAELSDDDFVKLTDWLRDYVRPRAPHVQRRNRPESLERRRYVLTMCRMAWPFETAAHRQTAESLDIELTDLEPLTDED